MVAGHNKVGFAVDGDFKEFIVFRITTFFDMFLYFHQDCFFYQQIQKPDTIFFLNITVKSWSSQNFVKFFDYFER